VRERIPLETLPSIQAKITDVNHQLIGRGRMVVRYSGTESLLRVMIESDEAERNERLMKEMLSTIQEALG
jgi:phosphoglucosamine mutase